MRIERNPAMFPVIKKKGAMDFICGGCHQRYLYIGVIGGKNKCPDCGTEWLTDSRGRPK